MMSRLNKKFREILIIYFLTRILLIFIKFDINEFLVAADFFEALRIDGTPIYETHLSFIPPQLYPPLFYYLAYILFYLGGTFLSMKIFWLIFDFLSVVLIYKIGNEMFFSKKKRDLYLNLYLLCPFVFLFTSLRGLGEIITIFFMLGSFFYFIKEKYYFAYIFLSLGILYGLFPIIMIIPYFLFLLNKKDKKLKNILTFFPVFILLFLLLSIPFFLTYGIDYLNHLFLIINRSEFSIGFYLELPAYIDQEIYSINILGVSIGISIYRLLLISIIVFSTFLFIFRFKIDSNEKLNLSMVFFLIIFPIIGKSFHFRNLVSLIPFLLLFLLSNQPLKTLNTREINKASMWQVITFSIGNLVILIVYSLNYIIINEFSYTREAFYVILIIYCIVWGFFLLVQNLTKLLYLEGLILFYCFFLIFFIVYGYTGTYLLIFLLLYILISIFTLYVIFKNWNNTEEFT
jgi:hypothetical protein